MYNFFNSNNHRTLNSLAEGNVVDFETLQNARRDLIGEIQAIIDYDYHLHSTNNKLAISTWMSIKNEELAHVGELLALLNYLDPTQCEFVRQGFNEVNEMMKN